MNETILRMIENENYNLALISDIIGDKPLRLIGELPVSECLAIGDTIIHKIKEFNAKKYYVYSHGCNLIASKTKLNNSVLSKKYLDSPNNKWKGV
jgi:hypothetical protein